MDEAAAEHAATRMQLDELIAASDQYRNGFELPIQGQENLAMLTITIIFALLVALWGRLGGAGASRG
jgi:hypothetical protein